MSQFAYMARSVAGTKVGAPSGWAFGWQYPGDSDNTPYPTTPISGGNIPGVPWPANWPIAAQANTAVVIDNPSVTMSLGTPTATIECYITVNGSQAAASVYDKHLIQVTCSELGATRNLKKNGSANYSTAIFYQVSNYAGNKWGFQQSIQFDTANMSVSDTWDIQGKLVTAFANPQGTDSWSIIS